MGLGIISVAPIQMARAFAVFANQGRDVTPIAIRSVEDRNGRVILDTEREVRLRQRRMGSDIQIVSPQNAYVMTGLLKKTVEVGTLAYGSGWGSKFTFQDETGRRYRIPASGKTGTTQNWADAWTVGFTPYYTTAIWFGFDKPGNSLGLSLTGATLAGPIWGDYMRDIHMGLPMKDFVRPAGGVVDITVCSQTGLLKTSACPGDITLPFLEGTQPTLYCDLHGNMPVTSVAILDSLRQDTLVIDDSEIVRGLRMPELRLDLLGSPSPEAGNSRNTGDSGSRQNRDRNRRTGNDSRPGGIDQEEQGSQDYGVEIPRYNPLLDYPPGGPAAAFGVGDADSNNGNNCKKTDPERDGGYPRFGGKHETVRPDESRHTEQKEGLDRRGPPAGSRPVSGLGNH
jgi:penicillin-binding protein 1A